MIEAKKRVKKSVTEDPVEDMEICYQQTYSMQNCIDHLTQEHQVPLKEPRDLCRSCELCYANTFDALSHLEIRDGS